MQTENENKITLSIIVPVYNVEKYLEDCVESLLNLRIPVERFAILSQKALRKSKLFIKKMVVYPQHAIQDSELPEDVI